MTTHDTSSQDQKKPKRQSSTSRQGKTVLIKKENKKTVKKSVPPKTTKNPTMAIPEPLFLNGPSTNGSFNARIAERAHELWQHRGGHHGQDLEDWLTAEREVLSEESCYS